MNHRARPRQPAMKRHHRIQQPIHRQPARLKIDPEKTRQKQIRLPRLHRDARRNPARVQIPRARQHIVLREHAPARHRPRLALNRENPIHQHQRFIRQPHPRGKRIRRRKFFSQHAPNRTNRKLHALLARQRHRRPRHRWSHWCECRRRRLNHSRRHLARHHGFNSQLAERTQRTEFPARRHRRQPFLLRAQLLRHRRLHPR